jgi:outer membrane protein assembly factor BamB/PKD repeat protein
MRMAWGLAAATLCILAGLAIGSQDVPWPCFRHDAQNTGHADYIGADVSAIKWHFDTNGRITSSPALGSGGRIYVGSRDGKLYCLGGDGALIWAYDTHATIEYSSPAIAPDGTIYITAFESGDQSEAQQGLLAINPDGTLKWLYPTTTAPLHSPVVGPDGSVVFGSNGGGLTCVSPDGTLRWVYGNYRAFSVAPAIGPDGSVYAADLNGRLHGIGADGLRKWTYNLGGMVSHGGAMLAADGTLYQGCTDGKLYAFTTAGALKWSCALGAPSFSTPALGDGLICIAADDGLLHAVGTDGAQRWTAPCTHPRSSPAVDYAGKVYLGAQLFSADGRLMAECAQATQTDSCPAVGLEGTVYVGSGNALLALSTGPVPQPQFNKPPVCSVAASPAEGHAPLLVSFRAEAGDPDGQVVRAAWDFGDGSGAEGLAVQHSYVAAGSYRVQLTVYDDLGAPGTAEALIEVSPPNQPPVCSIVAEPSAGRAPVAVAFRADATDPDGQVVGAAWDFGDGAVAAGLTATHTYTSGGSYRVKLTVYDDLGASGTAEATIAVLPPNQAPAVWASADVVEGPASLVVNLAAAGVDPESGPLTYAWDFGDGSTGTGQLVEHTYELPGTYTARVTVTDDGGLTASDEVVIKVTAKVPGKHLGLFKNLKWLEWLLKWLFHCC